MANTKPQHTATAQAVNPVADAQPGGGILLVPLQQLKESPFNPRKAYNQADLAELAESIKTQGVMQPIVARPLPGAQQDIYARYEIVFGHRRYRASQLAGQETIRTIVQDMTDEQAAIAQVHENLQRKDVTALEEADSFERLRKEHGMTADGIADALGKSRSYVYGRLKLQAVAPEVRTAVADAGLGAEVALELARLRDPVLQRKALAGLKDHDGSWCSVRHSRSRIHNMFNCTLANAKFDPADATLVAKAGACNSCPKLARNDPDLEGVLAADVCTDRACFEGKEAEHQRLEIITLRAMGIRVIEGEEAKAMQPDSWRTPAGFVALHARVPFSPPAGQPPMLMQELVDEMVQAGAGAGLPQRTVLVSPHNNELVHLLTMEEAARVVQDWAQLRNLPDPTATPSTAARAAGGSDAGRHAADANPDDLADWTPAELAFRDRAAWLQVKRATLGNVLRTPRTTDDLRAILLREYDMADGFGLMADVMGLEAEEAAAQQAWEESDDDTGGFSHRGWWEARLAAMTADQLGALLLGVALEELMGYGSGNYSREHAASKVALAQRYGTDVAAAARPEQMDGAGAAGGCGAQIDAFAEGTA
jgi:ParB/RepB/Spo0J family partition protein